MDFSFKTHRGRAVLIASMARSCIRDEDLLTIVHDSDPGHTHLWWHEGSVPLREGDTIYYFKTSIGHAIEAVVPS